MTFKAFSHHASDDTAIMWTEEMIARDPSQIGCQHDVVMLRTTDKGLMVVTSMSKAFIYKSHHAYNHVIEFVTAWSGKMMKSPLLMVEITSSRPFIILGIDDSRSGVWGKQQGTTWRQAYATVNDNPSSPPNPFPLPASPGDSVLSEDSAGIMQDTSALQMQTSQDLPLEAPARLVNGAKGRKTRQGG